MLKLVIGGSCQGKLDFALQTMEQLEANAVVCDGKISSLEESLDYLVIDHLHLMLRRLPQADEEYETIVDAWLDRLSRKLTDQPDRIQVILLDDIGCGVVPFEAADRRWRDRCGRLYCRLTAMADQVDRIWAGLPQRLKGAN